MIGELLRFESRRRQFTSHLIELRRQHPALRRREFFRGYGPDGSQRPDVIWHGVEPLEPDFSHHIKTLALTLNGSQTGRGPDRDFYMAFNAWECPLPFKVPPAPQGRPWRRVVDTSLESPQDIVVEGEGPIVPALRDYRVGSFSLVVLISEP